MLISSLEKLSAYTGLSLSAGNHPEVNRRRLSSWRAALSAAIERLLMRGLEIKGREEVLEVPAGGRVLFLSSTPILEVESIQYDRAGLFNGSEETVDASSYAISADGESIIFDAGIYPGLKVKVRYTGGLARHAVQSVYEIEVEGEEEIEPGEYVRSEGWDAVGIVRALEEVEGKPLLTVENLYGRFEPGELSFAATEADLFKTGDDAPEMKATITAIESRGLSEACPDLERAVEAEARYMVQHQMDFENISTMDGQTQRRQQTTFSAPYTLQPETLMLLARYRKVVF